MKVVAGRYAIQEELGRGGMGVVWRAEDQVIGRQVALKELPTPAVRPGPSAAGTAPANHLERILREARTAGRLNDPAIVTVFDVLSENGTTYIVMELVEAPTLADLIAAHGPIPAARVVKIGLQVLGALETAHAAGIIHRDVKPSNIMVLPDDRVKLADFGIARAMDDPSLTMTGGIMGSPGYMAPELFSGSAPSPASDLWALGATLFHAVEGRSPFNRETTAATMHAIMYDDPQLTQASGPLAQVILGLLAQPAETRFTVARTRELLTATDATHVVADTTQVVDAPTVQVMAVRRDTLPREPWQESFPPEVPLAAPAQPSWTEDPWDTPKKKSGRGRVMLLAGAGAVVVAALVAVFLISPGSQRGEATSADGTPTVSAVAANPTSGEIPASTTSTAAPSSTISSTPPASTVTVIKSVSAKQPTPPPGQSVGQPPTQAPDKPQRQLVQITRFNHPKGPHFTATPAVAAPAGFNREFPMGWLVAAAEPGTKRLYACQLKGSEDRMTSVDPGCEGNTQIGALGYIFTAKPAGVNSRPYYRCTYTGGHYDSTDAKCEGYTTEFQFGWVLV